MKKMIFTLAAAVTTLLAADSSLFTGSWCVEDEGITLTFTGDSTVTFSSEDDETISGSGTFAYDDTTLTATLDNEGMIMEVMYGYTANEETVSVVTKSLKVNGDAMETSDEEMNMIRCNNEDVAVNDSEENIEEEK